MEVENEPGKGKKYGRVGCIVALIILAIVIILFVSGLINFPGMT